MRSRARRLEPGLATSALGFSRIAPGYNNLSNHGGSVAASDNGFKLVPVSFEQSNSFPDVFFVCRVDDMPRGQNGRNHVYMFLAFQKITCLCAYYEVSINTLCQDKLEIFS